MANVSTALTCPTVRDSSIQDFLEWFWLELWNRRAMDEMLEQIDPAFVQQDHRALELYGPTREDWRQVCETWWELVPDVRCVEVSSAETAAERTHYGLRFVGTYGGPGATMEVAFHVVSEFADGRFTRADLFEERDEALAFLRGG